MATLSAERLLRRPADLQRPWLHHLNGDTSWLLQVPRGAGCSRAFINVLIDPWFEGPNVQATAYFHQQEHTIPPAVHTIAEVQTFLQEVERTAQRLRCDYIPHTPPSDDDWGRSLIDGVAITLDANDHCHKDTLLQVPPYVPVYALKRSAKMIGCWKHFDKVFAVPFYTGGRSWRTAAIPLASTGLSIAGLKQPDDKNMFGLFVGLLLTFEGATPHRFDASHSDDECFDGHTGSVGQTSSGTEAIVYLPHGICPNHLQHLATSAPPLKYLALIQGLHLINFGIPFGGWNFDSNLGAHDAFKTQRLLRAKYWFGTHDELKIQQGFTSYLQTNHELGFEDAIKHSMEPDEVEKYRKRIGREWCELGSGESKLLLP